MPIFAENPKLLRPFRAGERGALEEVYWAYVDKVERSVRFGAGGGAGGRGTPPAADLADVVQEVFVKAFAPNARQAYDGERPYGPYLLAIARNLLIDWARVRQREVPTELDTLERAESVQPPPHADPWTLDAVESCLSQLPPDLLAVHQKRFVEGLSQRHAAEALGIGRQVVRTLEDRLRDMLRRRLAQGDRPHPAARTDTAGEPTWGTTELPGRNG
jgi:RNA polymerase sigma-70 factor (ECF subfamily)